MKNTSLKDLLVITCIAACTATACKNGSTNTTNKDSGKLPDTTVMTDQPASTGGPVKVSPDDSLTTGAKDATKDFPGVTATVNNGEVTLTGNITRDKLPKLMQNISSLHPKKINNNLTISK